MSSQLLHELRAELAYLLDLASSRPLSPAESAALRALRVHPMSTPVQETYISTHPDTLMPSTPIPAKQ